MADYKYAYNGPTNGVAKAVYKDAPISTKVAIEVSKHIKGKTTEAAKALLERVIKKQQAIPYTRFTDGVGHKKGKMAAGRYPEKASQAFLQLIKVAEANANQAGLASDLKIIHLLAHKASSPFHYGRQRRRQMKRTHVEIVVKEMETKNKPATKKAAPKTTDKKAEPKAATKPVEPVVKEAVKPEAKTAPKTEAPKAEVKTEKASETKPVTKEEVPKTEAKSTEAQQ